MKETDGDSWLLNISVRYKDRRTSLRLEPEMWRALRSVAAREDCHTDDVFMHIDEHKPDGASLTSATRAFLLEYYRAASSEAGHAAAGHGQLIKRLKRDRKIRRAA